MQSPPDSAPVILFDLDGTITDSAPGVVASFRTALESRGVAVPDGDLRSRIVGPPMAVTMAALDVPDGLRSELLAAYHEHYSSVGWRNTTVFPGMADLLADLAGPGAPGRPAPRLAVTTSKQQGVARKILAEHGLAEHFEVIAGAEGERHAKADVIAHALARLGIRRAGADGDRDGDGSATGGDAGGPRIMLVGDRSHDVLGAQRHGIPTAFVRWGYGTPTADGAPAAEEARGAAWVLGTPAELAATIARYTRARADDADGADHKAPAPDDGRLHVTFVCTGNICRSPMAEKIVSENLRRAGLADAVRVSSAGIGDWHVGDQADPRARAELRGHGYPSDHTAAQFGARHLDADLIVALDSGHYRSVLAAGADPHRVRMLRGFDAGAVADAGARSPADAPAGSLDVADPYYGAREGFTTVREQIEAAVPGVLEWLRRAVGAQAEQAARDAHDRR